MQPDALPRQVRRRDFIRPGRQAAHAALVPPHLREPASGAGRADGYNTSPRRARGDRHDGALSPRPERRQNSRRRKPSAAYRGVAKCENRPIASIVSKRDSGTILVRVLV